jgi:hypothetical protein
MAVRLTKDWIPVSEVLTSLKGNLGVFEFANVQREVVFIGFAGGKSQFGLKGEVASGAGEIFRHCRVPVRNHNRISHALSGIAYGSYCRPRHAPALQRANHPGEA